MTEMITIGPAKADEAKAISAVLEQNLEDQGLFQESADAIGLTLGDFPVAHNEKSEALGYAGLHLDSAVLAEIYAVAVTPECQGKGVGRRLIQECLRRARERGVRQLWLATIKPGYFARYGFGRISRWQLPAGVLLRKLRQTFDQPIRRWRPALFGRHTFMMCAVRSRPNGDSAKSNP